MPRSIKTALLYLAAAGLTCLAAGPAQAAAAQWGCFPNSWVVMCQGAPFEEALQRFGLSPLAQRPQETGFRLLWSDGYGAGYTFAVEVKNDQATLVEVRGDMQIRTGPMRVGHDATAQLRRYITAAMKTAAQLDPDAEDAVAPGSAFPSSICMHGPNAAVELRGAGEYQRGTVNGCYQSEALRPLWEVTRAVIRRFPNCMAALGRTPYQFPRLSKCGGRVLNP